MANIAVNIKRLRLQKGITQEAFAKTVNVSRQAISSWETGRTQPDIEMIGSLADALGVSIEELIYGEKRNIKIDDNGRTSNPKIYAGGDVAGIKGTVAWAAKSGRVVAESILNSMK